MPKTTSKKASLVTVKWVGDGPVRDPVIKVKWLPGETKEFSPDVAEALLKCPGYEKVSATRNPTEGEVT